ncbi:MAG: hypothetical protein ACOC97_00780 [Myxococcota bacterium]
MRPGRIGSGWKRRLPVAGAGLLAAAVTLVAGGTDEAQAWGDGDGCVPLYGLFDSEQVPPEECDSPVGFCTRGNIQGLLSGTYEFTMTSATPADPTVPGIQFFTGVSEIETRGDALVTATDTGTIDLSPDRWGNMTSLITIIDGTGHFEGARGQLALRGRVDLESGGASGNYTARICLPK